MKVLKHGGVYVVRARRGASEVFMDSGMEFEWGDREVVGERTFFGVEKDRVDNLAKLQVRKAFLRSPKICRILIYGE